MANANSLSVAVPHQVVRIEARTFSAEQDGVRIDVRLDEPDKVFLSCSQNNGLGPESVSMTWADFERDFRRFIQHMKEWEKLDNVTANTPNVVN